MRFEIFRRDNHACRYCGAAAPDAKLTVDHVVPVALGGTDDSTNLVTACSDCNAGKSSATPEQPLVADVAADALRWGRAMAMASDSLLADHGRRQELHDEFLEQWNAWTYGSPPRAENFPLPGWWPSSVDKILNAGLPMPVLLECIDLAMAARHVKIDSLFRYMCGIAWRKVEAMQEIARALVETDGE